MKWLFSTKWNGFSWQTFKNISRILFRKNCTRVYRAPLPEVPKVICSHFSGTLTYSPYYINLSSKLANLLACLPACEPGQLGGWSQLPCWQLGWLSRSFVVVVPAECFPGYSGRPGLKDLRGGGGGDPHGAICQNWESWMSSLCLLIFSFVYRWTACNE